MFSALPTFESISQWLTALFMMMAQAASVEPRSKIELMQDVTQGFSPAVSAHIAAEGPKRLAVGWCVEEGTHEGIFVRQRNSFLWDTSPVRVAGSTGIGPRDLSIAYDDSHRIHMVWTAVEGLQRAVFYAALSDQGELIHSPLVINPTDMGDADYPLIAWSVDPAGAGLVFVTWQAGELTHFTVEAVAIDPASGAITRLPAVSGASRAAMSPQILRAYPPTVAWYEILDSANEVRISIYGAEEAQWKRIDLPGLKEMVPPRRQPILVMGSVDRLYACWNDERSDEPSVIRIARGLGGEPENVTLPVPEAPEGEPRQPQLLHSGVIGAEDQLTLAWQIFYQGAQSVRVAAIKWGEAEPPQVFKISPEAHRFASDPSHASFGAWSAVVWTDDYADGGTGEVGFAEINWPGAEAPILISGSSGQ